MFEKVTNSTQKPSVFKTFALQGIILAVGAGLGYGFLQWQQQQQKLADLTALVTQMQQMPPEIATRNAPLDLVEVGTAINTAPVAVAPTLDVPVIITPVVAETAIVETVAPAAVTAAESTADKIQNLVAAAGGGLETSQTISDARRIETLAIIAAGVEELVDAVVAGDYDIHTNYSDETFSGRIHFAFIGHEEDQTKLEQFLATAAENGVIAHSSSVVDGEGKVNGHILLFDLVERSLENGTSEEQRAVATMRAKAVALLAADSVVASELGAADADGERYYIVESGDSLAYIALQFYGNTQSFSKIFEANRDKLRTPERINVGQRLLIPAA